MTKKNIIIFVVSILAILGGFFWYFYSYFTKKATTNIPQTGNIATPITDESELKEKIQLLNSELDEVEDRLEELEYVPIAINTFTNSVNIVEKGTSINSILFNFTLNKTPLTLSIDNGIGAVTGNSFTKNELTITVDTTFTLTASDEKNTVTKTSSIRFDNRMFYGSSPKTSLANDDIVGLQNSVLVNTRQRVVTLAGNGQYPVIAFEASLGTPTFVMAGLVNTDWTITQQNITNASGNTSLFNICRMNSIQNASSISISIQ